MVKFKVLKISRLVSFFLLFGIGYNIFFESEAMSDVDSISYAISYIQSSPIIDGKIDNDEWQGAERVYLDNETYPSENIPALVDTEVLMMEDGINFYLAFIASDPDPDNIRAYFSDRDSCWDDDLVGVVIDTFNDERRAFQFFTNPLGVQIDSTRDDVVERDDSSWNAIWDSAGKISDSGYVVEMKIPLDQLRFPEGMDVQTWGIDLLRYYPRNKRHKFSNNTKDYGISCYLCQLKKMQGFEKIEPDLNLRFVPTVTASYAENRPVPQTDEWQSDFKVDAGMDIRWGINQNSYLNATINPDFSQVEADVVQLNVNNIYSLYYPEKREFFLDGADYFNTNANLVYTRNVSSPDYGIKLTGKYDVHTYGLFFTNDENTSFVIPGNQGSYLASLAGTESQNTVIRYRSDISKSMNLGVILTNRRADDYSNTVGGIDGNIRIGNSDRLEFQLMNSYTEYPEFVQTYYYQKPNVNDFAYMIDYEHDDSRWNWGARYTEYGNDFRADMGFITRVDYRKYDLSGGYTWRFGPEKRFNRIHVGAAYDKNYDEAGKDLGENMDISLNIDGPMQSFVFLTYFKGEELYNSRYFDEDNISLFTRMKPMAGLDMSFRIDYGDKIDYSNTRLGKRLAYGPRVDLQLGKHFMTSLRYNFEKMNVNGGTLYTSNIYDLRLTYQFTVRSFLRATIQYSDTKRDKSLYIYDLDSRSKSLNTQLLYSYKLTPQTRFFIGYSDTGHQNDELQHISKTNHTLFTKFSYAW